MRRSLLLLLLAACGDDTRTPPTQQPPTVEYLSPTEHLVRISMSLRGMRPSMEELDAVAADPAALEGIVDQYLESPEFGLVMRDLHAATLLTRVDLQNKAFRLEEPFDPLNPPTQQELLASYEEPLRLIEHVIVNNEPYSKILTTDYTFANPIAAIIWGLDREGTGPGWEKARYIDPRSRAGILSSSALMMRHTSAGANYHRGRANMLSSALLCFDFLHAEVVLDTSIDLANPDVVSNALRDNASCAACHQTLDPLASFLWGVQPQARYASFAVPIHWPQQYGAWATTTQRPPSYFGQAGTAQPTGSLQELGNFIANDPRFPRCAAARFAAYFTQTDRSELPFPWIAKLTDAFVASGLDAKQLAKAVVLSDEARVAAALPETSDADAENVRGMLRIRPEQLATTIEKLTGFHWRTNSRQQLMGLEYGSADLLRGDFVGFRMMAGGIDSYFVTQFTHTTTPVASLVHRTFAASAAGYVVDADFLLPPAQRKLLDRVSPTQSDEASIREQLVVLHARIFGELVAADSGEVSDAYALFTRVLAQRADVRQAWKTTLTAMLGDVRVAYY